MRAALYWAQYLKAAGVARIFGHPGTEAIELLEAAREAEIDFVLTQHEATAAFAAAMTGHLTGLAGVCVATAGPGTTNLASGIAQAYMDRMPMVAFTGDHPIGPGQPRHQRLPPGLYGPITKSTMRVTATGLAKDLPRAFALAQRHPQGPVHVTFSSDEMMTEVGQADISVTPESPSPSDFRVPAEVHQLLAGARRPFVVVGLGVANSHAEAAFRRFVGRLEAPVADTPQARGALPTNHPQYLGTFATHRDAMVTEVANTSDLIVAVGLDSVEFLKPWRLKPPVLALVEAGAADAEVPAAATLEGPLSLLLDALADHASPGQWDLRDIARHRADAQASLRPPGGEGAGGRLWPQTVLAQLQAAIPPGGITTVDVGSHKLLMVMGWNVFEPASFLNSSGLSSMGTGLPFAIAARLVHSSRPVMAVIGDGGFLMYAGELATVARLSAPLVIVVMADAALYSIKIKQVRRSYPPVGTEFDGVEVAQIARAFGIDAERVSDADALDRAVRRGLASDRPLVIEALIDPAGYELSQ